MKGVVAWPEHCTLGHLLLEPLIPLQAHQNINPPTVAHLKLPVCSLQLILLAFRRNG